ncbi:MAG: PspC domain-containing protein [Chloroflexota bacterium]
MNDRLHRSLDDRIIAGVAGGLADYWGTDPSWIRVIWVVLAIITGGLGLLVYIVMAIVVPQEDHVMTAVAPPPIDGSPADPTVAGAAPVATAPMTRSDWRAERRAQREARRAARGPGSFGIVVGAALVLIGIWYLLREYLPGFDADRVWPFALVGLGVVLLIAGIGRRPRAPGDAG